MGTDSIKPSQCRAARAMLDWSRATLAATSGVGARTLADFETGKRLPHQRVLRDVREALESAGIKFLDENDHDGPGVRLRI